MTEDDLCYLPVSRQLELFALGDLSPREVLLSQLRRTDSLGPLVRAVTDRFDDRALEAAMESEERWRRGRARPLEGITVALKEEHAIAGEPLLLGSMVRKRASRTSAIDHPVVERVRRAGAIVHMRTTTPEYSAGGFSRSELWGETVSPWRADLSSGGSSGGSGAALAAGFTSTATGSDVAGSLRIPASACGVVGFKPPYGSIPALPTESFDTYCHDGAMGRGVRDALHLHDALSGQHPADFVSLPQRESVLAALDSVDVARLRVGIALRVGDAPQSSLADAGMRAAMAAVTAAGAEVVEVELPWRMRELARAAFAHYGSIMAPMIRASLGEELCDAEPYTKDFVHVAEELNRELGHFHSIRWEAKVQADLAAIFRTVDVVVCPTGMVPALPMGHDDEARVIDVDGHPAPVVHHLEGFFAMPFNMASRLPVFAVPAAARLDGPPASVQVAGQAYTSGAAAAIAAVIEEAAGWYTTSATRPLGSTAVPHRSL